MTGKEIKTIRKRLKFTQQDVADIVGINVMAIHRLENDVPISSIVMLKVFELLGILVVDSVVAGENDEADKGNTYRLQHPDGRVDVVKTIKSELPTHAKGDGWVLRSIYKKGYHF